MHNISTCERLSIFGWVFFVSLVIKHKRFISKKESGQKMFQEPLSEISKFISVCYNDPAKIYSLISPVIFML